MKRRLFNLAAAVSLVMMPATLLIWVRSYFVGDFLFYQQAWDEDAVGTCWTQHNLQVGRGSVGYNYILQTGQLRRVYEQNRNYPFRHAREPEAPYFHFRDQDVLHWGFNIDHFRNEQTKPRPLSEGYLVIVPLWSLTLVFAVIPLIWYLRFRARRRIALTGCCPRCGYDLRATPDRCPECGATVLQKPAEAAA